MYKEDKSRYDRTVGGFVESLSNEMAKFFNYFRPVIVGIDDLVDSSEVNPRVMLEFRDLFDRCWDETPNGDHSQYEKGLIETVRYLRKMNEGGFPFAKDCHNEILGLFEVEYDNLSRKWKVLPAEKVRNIARKMGKHCTAGVLYVTLPELGKEIIEDISYPIGQAIKEADNLADIYGDISNGFINVPEEKIAVVRGINLEGNRIMGVNSDLWVEQDYLESELARITKDFETNDLMLKTLKGNINRKILHNANIWLHYWLDESRRYVESQHEVSSTQM